MFYLHQRKISIGVKNKICRPLIADKDENDNLKKKHNKLHSPYFDFPRYLERLLRSVYKCKNSFGNNLSD